MSQVRIGTSGWTYAHWRGVFYPRGLPQARWLEHYAAEFDSVELNASFYRLPAETAFSGWRCRTPDGFLFSLKAPRSITHIKRLADCAQDLGNFLSRADLLRDRRGPILFQLPPRWPCDLSRLADFLASLPAGLRFAFEFRDESWLCDPVYSLLQARNAALVRVSAPRYPDAEARTAGFSYLRMHGEERLYASKYSEQSLRRWAEVIADWTRAGQQVFVYFNNDARGHAVADARALRLLVSEPC
jgi:uncharacterized protein YecE (DUF72 family)